jgi:hypothetical protein
MVETRLAASPLAGPATRTSQVVENLPSIYVRRIGGDRYAIYGRGVGGVECPATLWLDGIRVGGGSEPMRDRRGSTTYRHESDEIDALVSPTEIAGVEVYARGMIAHATSSCRPTIPACVALRRHQCVLDRARVATASSLVGRRHHALHLSSSG